MPSRKRAKGRARRAAKAASVINSIIGCVHGHPSAYKSCKAYIDTLRDELASHIFFSKPFTAALSAMAATHRKHPHTLKNEASRALVKKFVLANGAEIILENTARWRDYAGSWIMVLNMIDHFMFLGCNQIPLKDLDAIEGGERSIIRFYHKHIPCACLEAKYSASKSLSKTGACCNCGNRKPKRDLLVCQGCKLQQVCSYECHLACWSDHKEFCEEINKTRECGSK